MKYRLGKKQNRVVLDDQGNVIATFEPGQEDLAQDYVEYLNDKNTSVSEVKVLFLILAAYGITAALILIHL
jgi:thymidylate kinase